MFIGYALTGSNTSLKSVAPTKSDYNTLTIKNAVFDYVFATVSVIKNFNGTISKEWTFDTRLYAEFNNNSYGGNVQFTEAIVEAIRIKRKTPRDNKFKTIFEKIINTNEDFEIEFIDYLEPVGTIEYAYVPIISGGESNYIINKVESKFDNYFICEKDISYPMIIEAEYNQSVNYESSNVKPLGRKYPITVVNGNTGYKSGDMNCVFVEMNDCELNVKNSLNYRDMIYNMLTNKQPKILKDNEGNILIINIDGNIEESDRQYLHQNDKGFYYVKTQFNWVECGDAYDIGDLYDSNLIDAEVDRN